MSLEAKRVGKIMKTGIKTIIAGGVLILASFVVPLPFVLPLILGKQDVTQLKAPGSMSVAIKEPGRYYVWNDFRTVYNGKSYELSEDLPGGFVFDIRDADGRPIEFVSDASITTTSGSSARKSVGYVGVQTPGKLTVQISGGNEERVFSFSQSGLLKMFGLVMGGWGLAAIVAIAGIGLIVRGIVKLGRAKRIDVPSAATNATQAVRL